MALVRLLWNQILFVAETMEEVAKEIAELLTNIGMTLPNIKDEPKKKKKKNNIVPAATKKLTKEFKQLKKTKFAYPDWIRLLEHHADLVLILEVTGMDKEESDAVCCSSLP